MAVWIMAGEKKKKMTGGYYEKNKEEYVSADYCMSADIGHGFV